MTVTYSTPFQPKPDTGFRLEDARTVWDAIVNLNGISQAAGLVAAGTTRATALPLTAVLNELDTVGASSGVNLPLSTGLRTTPYSFCIIINNGANTVTVYGAQTGSDTIDGVAAATGVAQIAGTTVLYVSAKAGAWFAIGSISNASFAALTAGTLTVTSAAIFNDAVNLAVGSATGTQIATSAGQKLGFWGVTPVVQGSVTSFAAVATTAVTTAAGIYGFTTAAQAANIISLLNQIRAIAVAEGLAVGP